MCSFVSFVVNRSLVFSAPPRLRGRFCSISVHPRKSAVKILAKVLGFVVAGCVMAFIVFLIFRLANFYIGTINDAVKMTR